MSANEFVSAIAHDRLLKEHEDLESKLKDQDALIELLGEAMLCREKLHDEAGEFGEVPWKDAVASRVKWEESIAAYEAWKKGRE